MLIPFLAIDLSRLTGLVPKGIWWVALAALALQAIPFIVVWVRRRRAAGGIDSGGIDLDRMDPAAFVEAFEVCFSRQGYRVERMPYAPNSPSDLVVSRGDQRTLVLMRRGRRPAGAPIVHEAHAVCESYRCSGAIVVATAGFTPAAHRAAREDGVTLWDRAKVAEQFQASVRLPGSALLEEAPRRSVPSTCVVCGDPVSDAQARACRARPERFGGRVYCPHHQDQVRSRVA